MGNQLIKVLIVDDHAFVRKGMKALLNEYEDITVIGEAENGLIGVELVERLKPDIVLIDLVMPVLDGIEAIKRMIAIRPDQRIIVLTAYPGNDKLTPAIRAGALGYLVKGFQSEDLISTIRKAYEGEPSRYHEFPWTLHQGMQSVDTTKEMAVALLGAYFSD